MPSRRSHRRWTRPLQLMAVAAALGLLVLSLPPTASVGATDDESRKVTYSSITVPTEVEVGEYVDIQIHDLTCGPQSGERPVLFGAMVHARWDDPDGNNIASTGVDGRNPLTVQMQVPEAELGATYRLFITIDLSNSPCYTGQTFEVGTVRIVERFDSTVSLEITDSNGDAINNVAPFGSTLTAMSRATINGVSTIQGSVEFELDGSSLGTAQVDESGIAAMPLPTDTSLGLRSVTAHYSHPSARPSTTSVAWGVSTRDPAVTIDPGSYSVAVGGSISQMVNGTIHVDSGVPGYDAGVR